MIVREATLDDTQGIVAVHLTNPDRPIDRPLGSLSIWERCGYGGPWMSVETCAIHLNNLVAWGYPPLVVEHEGRVVAETEFYVGPDIPPFGRTLDISVLYVHSDYQRRGVGSLLMEEMITRSRRGDCDYITVSGGPGTPAFYRRFGFSQMLDLQIIDCEVPALIGAHAFEAFSPGDFEELPRGTLWIGRFHSPCQKWREAVDRIKKRDAILPQGARRPEVVVMRGKQDGCVGALVPTGGNPAKVDICCWSEAMTSRTVSQLLAQANVAGYRQACFLCHPEMVGIVGKVCGSSPSSSWPIWAKKL